MGPGGGEAAALELDVSHRCDSDTSTVSVLDSLTLEDIDRLVQLGYISIQQGELRKKKLRDRETEKPGE